MVYCNMWWYVLGGRTAGGRWESRDLFGLGVVKSKVLMLIYLILDRDFGKGKCEASIEDLDMISFEHINYLLRNERTPDR